VVHGLIGADVQNSNPPYITHILPQWEIFPFLLHVVQTGSGAHLASYPVGTGAFPPGLSDRGVRLTTHFQPVPRSRKRGSKHPLPYTRGA
jgi:hypothetical protein